jgi:hypothetical protein
MSGASNYVNEHWEGNKQSSKNTNPLKDTGIQYPTPYILINFTNVSGEYTASYFRWKNNSDK